MSLANPQWGAPRIHGELLKLGLELSEATVAKYMVCHRKPPSQTWRTFLANHMKDTVSSDFFVVPTVFFRVFVFVILSHDRRRPVHLAVTEHPTAEWVARQLLEAFPWDSAPHYLLRDRDGSYRAKFQEAASCLGIREVLTAPQSPWQNAYVERLIGSIRRECLDHVIVLDETGLRRILKSYFDYYERTRTHPSLDKDAPISRPVQPPEIGRSWKFPRSVACTIATSESPPEWALDSSRNVSIAYLLVSPNAVSERIGASGNHLWLSKRIRHRSTCPNGVLGRELVYGAAHRTNLVGLLPCAARGDSEIQRRARVR
jgi:transposase InsO family protein